MRDRFFAWLARQLWPYLEPQVRARAAAIAAEESAIARGALREQRPARRFIGQ